MEDQPPVLQFGPFTLDRANRELHRDGESVELGSRYFDALALLARNPGELVTKDRFMAEVWRGIPVTDEALTQCIRTLRRTLADQASHPAYIETVPKHGYRFVAPVETWVQDVIDIEVELALPARIAGASTIGGGVAGVFGGLFYGVTGTDGTLSSVLVLIALGAALGTLAGAGVGSGMAAGYARGGRRLLSFVIGGAIGGTAIGALGQLLAHGSIAALTGSKAPATTGVWEGLAIGVAAGVASGLVFRHRNRGALALAPAFGAVAGFVIAFADGRMLGLSLLGFERSFPASRLAMEQVGRVFGEDGFSMFTILGTSMIECATFVAAMALAAVWAGRAV